MSDKFPIGKYEGRSIRAIVEEDPDYCVWANRKGIVALTRVQIYLCKKYIAKGKGRRGRYASTGT